MKTFEQAERIRSRVKEARDGKRGVGFVPTMGALHAGHMELVRTALEECERVAASIFVNPEQFDRVRDAEAYPERVKSDQDKLSQAGVDWLFLPDYEEVYPPGNATKVIVRNRLTDVLEAKHREHFFDGVTGVVTRLINMIPADTVFFGEKDLQQLLVIRRLARDLRYPQTIRPVPVVRDESGIAYSSRNRKLNDSWRQRLGEFSGHFLQLREQTPGTSEEVRESIRSAAARFSLELDYAEVVSVPDLQPVEPDHPSSVMVVAGHAGQTRFIDNTPLYAASVGDLLGPG